MTVSRAIRMLNRPVFTTREIAGIRGGSLSATSQALQRLQQEGLIEKVTRGVWCDPSNPGFTPLALIPFLAGAHRAYLSLLSALHLHGLIEQIPQIVYCATTGATRTVKTPQGSFSFHHLHPGFFKGYDWYGTRRDFLVASPEKALVDCLYLASRKGSRFRYLPELHLGNNFRFLKARSWLPYIAFPRIRTFVSNRLHELEARYR